MIIKHIYIAKPEIAKCFKGYIKIQHENMGCKYLDQLIKILNVFLHTDFTTKTEYYYLHDSRVHCYSIALDRIDLR